MLFCHDPGVDIHRVNAAVVVYHYITTFATEVDLFWKRKFTGATAMFLLNRYLILISYVLELVSVWIKSDYVSGGFQLLSHHCRASLYQY